MRLSIQVCTVAGTLALLTAFCLSGVALAGKSYSAESYTSRIAIEKEGSLLVTETVLFYFSGGKFTYVYRNLPQEKTDGISVISARMDGKELPEGTTAKHVEITKGSQIKVKWHFDPTDKPHTFVLVYRAKSVIQKNADADFFNWNALPTDYDYTIKNAKVTVSYPVGARPLGTPVVERGQAKVETRDTTSIFTVQKLKSATPLQISQRFQKDTLTTVKPDWQKQNERTGTTLPYALLGAFLFLAAGLVPLILFALRYRRGAAPPATMAVSTEPPVDLHPAVINALNSVSGGPNWNGVLATIFGLANRGVLRIVDLQRPGSIFKAHRYQIEFSAIPMDLEPPEQGLFNLLFQERYGPAISLTKAGQLYASRSTLFNKPVQQWMRELGLIDPIRERGRHQLTIFSSIELLLSLAIGLLMLLVWVRPNLLSPIIILIPGGLALAACIGYILTLSISPLSDKGYQESLACKNFAGYLHKISRGKAPASEPDLFARYLLYATTFGLLPIWARYFQKRHQLTIPPWFSSTLAQRDMSGAFVHMAGSSAAMGGSSAGAGSGGAAGGGGSGAG